MNQDSPTSPRDSGASGLAIASFVLGIVSIVLGIAVIGILPAVVGVILGGIALRRSARAGLAAWGVGTSVVGLLLSLGMGILFAAMFSRMRDRGESRRERPSQAAELKASDAPWEVTALWSVELAGARAVSAGDLDGDGIAEVLVGTSSDRLHRLAPDGRDLGTVPLPLEVTVVEVGVGPDRGVRMAVYGNWGHQVAVLDATGRRLWSHPCPQGVDGAHWGDLDGDGVDELVVGSNGDGGLVVLSSEGQVLWGDQAIGNVWNQAVVAPAGTLPGRVFATEAGGSVRVYDPAGTLVSQLDLDDSYCAAMSAARLSGTGDIQILGEVDDEAVVAADASGRVAWRASVSGAPGHWRQRRFVAADLDGDGVREWIFHEKPDRLIVASGSGTRLGEIVLEGPSDAIAGLPRAGGDLLLVRRGDQTTAYGMAGRPATP